MFRKFQISNRLPDSYFPKIDVLGGPDDKHTHRPVAACKLSLITANRTRIFKFLIQQIMRLLKTVSAAVPFLFEKRLIIHWRKRFLAPCFTENALIMQLRCLTVGLHGQAFVHTNQSAFGPFQHISRKSWNKSKKWLLIFLIMRCGCSVVADTRTRILFIPMMCGFRVPSMKSLPCGQRPSEFQKLYWLLNFCH